MDGLVEIGILVGSIVLEVFLVEKGLVKVSNIFFVCIFELEFFMVYFVAW